MAKILIVTAPKNFRKCLYKHSLPLPYLPGFRHKNLALGLSLYIIEFPGIYFPVTFTVICFFSP